MARRPGGAPKYDPAKYDELAYKFCLLGTTNEKCAELLDIALRTFQAWLVDHPSFKEAVRKGREIADAEVASGLFRRATGYEFTEEYYSRKQEEVVQVKKTVPPDPLAAALWLKKRQRELWGDKNDGGGPLLDDPSKVPSGITIQFVGAPQLPAPEAGGNGSGTILVGSARLISQDR